MSTVTEHKLTKLQEDCVSYEGRDLLIRGEPGSGKTTVLLKRARKLALKGGEGTSIIVFTFNKSLARFSRELVTGLDMPAIQVIHFHKWAWECLGRPKMVKSWEQRTVVQMALRQCRESHALTPRLAAMEEPFFEDEIAWIKGRMISSLDAYQAVDRIGRGTALRGKERAQVWLVYQSHQALLNRMRKLDWDDLAPELLRRMAANSRSVSVDHVMVDEAQDLQEAELKVMRGIAAKTLTIAADEGQKIYRTTFSWQSIGINVRGVGSKRLTTTFRSTRQIVALAASLRQHDRLASESPNAVEYSLPDVEGPLPILCPASDPLAEEQAILGMIKKVMQDQPATTIGVLAREHKMLDRIRNLLNEHHLAFQNVADALTSIITPGIKISTFHAAKGLEFDFVILVQLVEGTVPEPLQRAAGEMEADEMEEHLAIERRLLYVSMTRAKLALFMTYGGVPSRFIQELNPTAYTVVNP